MNELCVWDNTNLISPHGFVSVTYEDWAQDPRDEECNVSKIYTWDNGWYSQTHISSPDEKPSQLFHLIEGLYDEAWLDRKYDKYVRACANGTDDYDHRYEWLFELIEGINDYLPEVIACMNRRGVKAWAITKSFYGHDHYISMERDTSFKHLNSMRDEIIGVALIDEDMFEKCGCNKRYAYEIVNAEVKDYAAYMVGSVHRVETYGYSGRLVEEECGPMYGDVDGSLDLSCEFKELVEVDYDANTWAWMLDRVKDAVSPYLGYISNERAVKAVYTMTKARKSVPLKPTDDGWATMMETIIEGAA